MDKYLLVFDFVNNFSSANGGVGLLREIKDAIAREKESDPDFDDSGFEDIDTYFVYITEIYNVNYSAVARLYRMPAREYCFVFQQNGGISFFKIFLALLLRKKFKGARAFYFRIARRKTAYILLAGKHIRINKRIALFDGISRRNGSRSAHSHDIADNTVRIRQ